MLYSIINKDDVLFVVDEYNNPLEPKPPAETHLQGYWHRVTHIWVVNTKKQLLVQKRSMLKDMSPGMFEPHFGGHVGPGVAYIDGTLQEVAEELGLHCIKENLQFFNIYKSERVKEFQGIYALEWKGMSSDIDYEKEEIDEVSWHTIVDVKHKFESRDSQWVFPYYIEDMFTFLETLHTKS